jgi:hypothetical protein
MTPFLFLKSLEPGERWITLHPHGRDEKGQPVLIKPAGDGSYHVIGGAGGALNALKLVGVRSEESYKKEAAQRAQGRKEEAKRQAQSDRKAGLTESKAAIAEGLRATLGDERVKFVSKIAEAMGWKDDDLRFPEEKYQDVSPSARAKAADEHANALLKVAGQAVEFQRQRMVTDAETRMESGLGEIPMTSSRPDRLSVQDLDPIAPQTSGFGFATGYTKRAEAKGSTQEDISVEAEKIDPEEADKRKAREEAKAKTRSIEAELTGLRDVMPQVNPNVMVEAKRALDILKAAKQFAMVKSDVRAKVKKLKKDETIEPKAYLVETANRPVDQDVIADVENDLRTLRTRSFLDMAGPAEKLTRHVGIGAFNSINALALAAGGTAMIDRSVVDVLGVAGAAEVLARRLKHDLTEPEVGEIAQAMQAFHIDRYMEITQESMNEAKEMHEAAAEIALGEAEDTTDLAVMQELNAKRQDYVDKAQEILGTSLGEMEANAALVLALKQAPKQTIQVSLGKTDIRHAITQMRALGLEEGEYELEKVGASTMLTVRAPGIDKLAKPVSREDLQTVRESLAIINGDRDEDGWLPQGVSTRPELAMNAQQGVAPRLAKPFDTMTQDVKRAVADYIGGRAADGEAPADIMAGLLSEDIMRATDRTAFLAAVNEIAPLYDAQGKMIRVEKHAAAFDRLADDFVERAYGADRTPINRQNFKVNPASMEALHQALASNPDAVAAFKPVGDMTPQDQAAMRETFMREYGRTDPEAEKRRMAVEKLDSQEPAKESQGLFGMDANPDWSAWKQERDQAAELANAAAMTWGKYVGTMGSPQAAYAAMQDVVKSTAIKTFVDHYNTNQKTPLIIGRQVIANDLKHLDALDPEARARRAEQQAKLIDSLRTRVAGKYASGSVKEKEAAAREAEEAVSQSQMGLFATEAPKARKLALGERYTLGHAAERTIAGMMSVVGANFKPGQDPVKTFRPTMDGKYVARQRAVKLIKHNKRMMLGLGVGCVDGATMLGDRTFFEWWLSGKAPCVLAWDGSRTVSAPASPVFVKGCEAMFDVTLAGGQKITVTAAHRFLTSAGWRRLDQLSVGARVRTGEAPRSAMPRDEQEIVGGLCDGADHAFSRGFRLIASFLSAFPLAVPPLRLCGDGRPRSNSEPGLSVRPADDPRLMDRARAGQDRSARVPSYDGQPRSGGGAFLERSPLSGDVLERIQPHLHEGGLAEESARTPPYLPSCLLATRGSCRPSDLSWFAPIVAIRPVGLRLVFDITVPQYNCYFANGFLNHNSGKTAIMLSSFTDLKTSGGVKKGLFLVPSIVQGQFHGEALKMLDPGKFRWHADPSGDREARLRAYRDPENDFTVVTHQGFRDDFDHLAEQRDGMTSSKFDALPAAERKAYAANLMKQEGWNTDFLAVDEGHNLLNRAGKKNSHLANVVDAISGNTPYYVNATADPVKNDATEAADVLAKLEPERYTDRDAFIRRYGVNTPSAKAELQREMARHFYTGAIDPGVQAHRKTVSVQINPESGQHDDIKAIEDAASAVRAARSQGKTDVAAMKFLSPAAFEGVPEPLQEDVAKRLQTGLAMIRATAIQHAVNDGAKTEALAKIAGERKGKPGVVFIHRLDRVKQAAARLKKDGHRVVTLTGGDSSAEKDRKKADYQAGKYDIMVASDAGAVGANLQAGKWLVQYDTPMTAMLHAQRNGRIHRIGQTQDVELIDLIADHPSEKRARARLEKKYALREVMTSPLEGLDEQGLAGYLSQARAHTLDAERPGFVQAPADEPRPEGKGQLEMAA